jgi:hypothetical protein
MGIITIFKSAISIELVGFQPTLRTSYGQKASIEDYAESYVIYSRTLMSIGIDPKISVDNTRLALVVDSIK